VRFIDVQIGSWQLQIQKVLVMGEMKSGGALGSALALLEDVGDVFRAEGFEVHCVFDGPAYFVGAVDFA